MTEFDIGLNGNATCTLVDWPLARFPALEVGGSTVITVGFDPDAQGARSATVAVEANGHPVSTIEAAQSITIAGTGTAATMVIDGDLNFGDIAVGNTADRIHTILNQGAALLVRNLFALQFENLAESTGSSARRDPRDSRSERGLTLLRARAEAIKNWLVKHGIEPERIEPISYGELRSILWGRNRSEHSKAAPIDIRRGWHAQWCAGDGVRALSPPVPDPL